MYRNQFACRPKTQRKVFVPFSGRRSLVFIDINGVGKINVARSGPRGAPPLVLLHPVALDLTWWGDQFEAFRSEYDVIAFDMPGHGLSADLAASPTFDLMASVLEGVLETLGTGPANIVGISVGGMIAQT